MRLCHENSSPTDFSRPKGTLKTSQTRKSDFRAERPWGERSREKKYERRERGECKEFSETVDWAWRHMCYVKDSEQSLISEANNSVIINMWRLKVISSLIRKNMNHASCKCKTPSYAFESATARFVIHLSRKRKICKGVKKSKSWKMANNTFCVLNPTIV